MMDLERVARVSQPARGLKHRFPQGRHRGRCRAGFTARAWIETWRLISAALVSAVARVSQPARGLKHHPVRRGGAAVGRAGFTARAWIET